MEFGGIGFAFFHEYQLFYVAATVEIRITIRILGTGCGCRSGLVESKKNRKLSDEIHIAEGVRFC